MCTAVFCLRLPVQKFVPAKYAEIILDEFECLLAHAEEMNR
jgi:hypothetical protein